MDERARAVASARVGRGIAHDDRIASGRRVDRGRRIGRDLRTDARTCGRPVAVALSAGPARVIREAAEAVRLAHAAGHRVAARVAAARERAAAERAARDERAAKCADPEHQREGARLPHPRIVPHRPRISSNLIVEPVLVTPAIQGPRFLAPGDKLGKYELIRQIAVGGMAELYLGRTVGIEGFEKLAVLKRILPQYVSNAKLVNMFLGEARLAATLHHPNIAQVYDIGGEGGDFFFSMEYIHGEDLGRLIATA